MNANVSKLLNEQINKEFYSAYAKQFFPKFGIVIEVDVGLSDARRSFSA